MDFWSIISAIGGFLGGIVFAYSTEYIKFIFEKKTDRKKRTQKLMDRITNELNVKFELLQTHILGYPSSINIEVDKMLDQLEGLKQDGFIALCKEFIEIYNDACQMYVKSRGVDIQAMQIEKRDYQTFHSKKDKLKALKKEMSKIHVYH